MSETRLARAARDSEDVALGLLTFRDALPPDRAYIASVIGKLYEVSALFTRLDKASQHPQFQPSFFRIKKDLASVVFSVQATHRLALDMFGRTRKASISRVWDDMNYRMNSVEGAPFDQRLDWYKGSLLCCIAVLKEQPTRGREEFMANVIELLQEQQRSTGPLGQPEPARYEEPISPSSRSDGSSRVYPWAPDAPLLSPISTSSSRDTYESSQTSMSGHAFVQAPIHWAKDIFNGRYSATSFRDADRSSQPTRCEGPMTPDALDRLAEDGFAPALEVKFEDGDVRVHFFHRHTDNRARILYIKSGRQVHCAPLTSLKIVRDKSCLLLCQVVPDGADHKLRLWANLAFAGFERMCLFYSTFVAMKRQDSNFVNHEALIERDELREREPFGGKIKDRGMIHAIRLRRDPASGVVRIEATPYRGPMAGVPLWTAFVTSYKLKKDVYWAEHQGKGVVSLAALKPSPYVFLSGYSPPHKGKEWLLHFAEVQDAKDFCTAWTTICRQAD